MNPNRIFQEVKKAAEHQQACYEELKAEMAAEGVQIDWDVQNNKTAALNFITSELIIEWQNRRPKISSSEVQTHILAESFEIYNEWLILHFQLQMSQAVPK